MKTINKIKKFLEPQDKNDFKWHLVMQRLEIADAAEALGISEVYLYAILDGRRPLTEKLERKFESALGYKF